MEALTKTSSSDEIKAYFTAILKLQSYNEVFPINLDEVWPLVYIERSKAIRALKQNFIAGEDFKSIAQNGNGSKFTGSDYFLSLSCLEYFIARKVRPVFEVYRQVFHKVSKAPQKQLPSNYVEALEGLLQSEKEKQALLIKNSGLTKENELQSQQLQISAPKVKYVDTVLQSVNTYTATQLGKEMGLTSAESLNKKLKELGIHFKQSGQWMLTAKHCGKGYTKTRTQTFTRSDGSTGTNTITVWTEAGRLFIHELLNNQKI